VPVFELASGGRDKRKLLVKHFDRRLQLGRHQLAEAARTRETLVEPTSRARLVGRIGWIGNGVFTLDAIPGILPSAGIIDAISVARAISTREDGIVLVNEDICIGCNLCSWACPYGAREYAYDTGVMKKCTLCIDKIYNEHLAAGDRAPPASRSAL
jgi:NAD-dependent dihydropyrimidine dehydrogenase PreA subunit